MQFTLVSTPTWWIRQYKDGCRSYPFGFSNVQEGSASLHREGGKFTNVVSYTEDMHHTRLQRNDALHRDSDRFLILNLSMGEIREDRNFLTAATNLARSCSSAAFTSRSVAVIGR